MKRQAARLKTESGESCGNAGAVESVESQRQASHSFHEPLGNLAKGRRDSHISTAPATRRMEKWKTKSRFSTFPPPRFPSLKTKTPHRAGYRPPPEAALRAASRVVVVDREK
jgi:hypothetical protein